MKEEYTTQNYDQLALFKNVKVEPEQEYEIEINSINIQEYKIVGYQVFWNGLRAKFKKIEGPTPLLMCKSENIEDETKNILLNENCQEAVGEVSIDCNISQVLREITEKLNENYQNRQNNEILDVKMAEDSNEKPNYHQSNPVLEANHENLDKSFNVTCQDDKSNQKETTKPSSTERTPKKPKKSPRKKRVPEKTGHFECDICGKVFNRKPSLVAHLKIHLPKIKCHLCDAELKFWSMRNHLLEFHATERNFQCKTCSLFFKSSFLLSRHEKSHDPKFECEICHKKFIIQGQLNKHRKDYHENPESYKCEFCEKRFNRIEGWRKHVILHDKYRERSFKCDRCDYATHERAYFMRHLKFHRNLDARHAAIVNPLKCPKCDRLFKNKLGLKRHTYEVHPDRVYQCDLCGNYKKTNEALREHIQMHARRREKEHQASLQRLRDC